MLFAGPSGAGKSTRVHALLRELYGPGADIIKVETRTVAPNPNLYELLAACLPPDFIIKELLKKLVASQRNDVLKQKAVAAAAHFESTMRQGSKDIFHLEAFVLRFMADLKASEVRA